MKIAIIGATGTAGRATTRTARQAGYDVITLSRATGIDLHTGEGLTSALDGADVAIDTSNPFPVSADADLVATFRDTTARVVRACQHAGVDRLVVVGHEVVVMGRWGQRGLGCQDGWC